MLNRNLIVCFSCFALSRPALSIGEEGFQYTSGNYYQRKSYDNVNFDELFDDFFADSDISRLEYKFMINKGLFANFQLTDRIERLRRFKNETSSLISADELEFKPSPPSFNENVTFYSVRGLSHLRVDEAELVTLNESRSFYEVKSKIFLPWILFKGVVGLDGLNQSLDYEMSDIQYTDWQRKRVNDEYEIKTSRSWEKFRANETKLIARNAANIDGQDRQLLENEVTNVLSKYLPKVVERMRLMARNVTLSADIQYLRASRMKNVNKLSVVVANAVRSSGNVSIDIPRFPFLDESSSTIFNLISGKFEVNTLKTNILVTQQPNGDFVLNTPAEGALTYFVTEQNCNESCNTYGDQARIRAVNVVLTFNGRKLDKVNPTLSLEPGDASNGDHYLRRPADSITRSMLTKVSKMLSERLSTRLKHYLK